MQDQNFDVTAWWNEQSFSGKELFRLEETGEIRLLANNNIKERVVATISEENKEAVLKSLQDKFAQLEARVKETEVEWLAAEDKLKMMDKVAHVKEALHSAAAIGDYLPLAALVHDWEHTIYTLTEENYATRLKLAEQAESLAQSEDWKETAQAYRDIADKWKHIGHTDRGRSDKLWGRIEAARTTFQDRKRHHHEEEEKDMLHNLDLKMELVERAENLARSEEWKKTTEAFQKLMDEWKAVGHTVSKKNEELWQRFIAAKSAFFDRKREHAKRIHTEQERNYEIKKVIVEKAEALRDSTEWGATAQAFTNLMEEWKGTGRVPSERGDDLWNQFIGHKEHFFDAKKKHFDGQRASQEQNYQLKKVLLERAEKLKNSNKWGEATAEMVEMLEEWKKIGPVPRAYGDKMWEDFNAARRYFFARKDANREQRKQFVATQKVTKARHAKEAIGRLEDDIREEEEKLEDFRNGLENITPGKKAAELRAHLENLVAETTARISQLKQKYAQAQKDISAGAPKPVAAETANDEPEENEVTEDGEE